VSRLVERRRAGHQPQVEAESLAGQVVVEVQRRLARALGVDGEDQRLLAGPAHQDRPDVNVCV
jgi:hypothetical protein